MADLILKPIGTMLALAILFGGMGFLVGGANGWFTTTIDKGDIKNESVTRIVAADSTVLDADDAWFKQALVEIPVSPATETDMAAGNYIVLTKGTTDTTCGVGGKAFAETKGANVLGLPNTINYFTQNGTKMTASEVASCKWEIHADFWDAGGLGTLVRLIFRIAGLGIPFGAMFALAMFGKAFATNVGVNPIFAIVGLIIVFLLGGGLLDVLTPFIGDAFDAVSAPRYDMYQGGIGVLAQVAGNFYAVVIAGGFIALGWQAVRMFMNASQGGGGILGSGASSARM